MLEELLSDFLPEGFQITNKRGQIVVYTGLRQDHDGELIDIKTDDDLEEEEDIEFGDEDLDSLEEDEEDEEELENE